MTKSWWQKIVALGQKIIAASIMFRLCVFSVEVIFLLCFAPPIACSASKIDGLRLTLWPFTVGLSRWPTFFEFSFHISYFTREPADCSECNGLGGRPESVSYGLEPISEWRACQKCNGTGRRQ